MGSAKFIRRSAKRSAHTCCSSSLWIATSGRSIATTSVARHCVCLSRMLSLKKLNRAWMLLSCLWFHTRTSLQCVHSARTRAAAYSVPTAPPRLHLLSVTRRSHSWNRILSSTSERRRLDAEYPLGLVNLSDEACSCQSQCAHLTTERSAI